MHQLVFKLNLQICIKFHFCCFVSYCIENYIFQKKKMCSTFQWLSSLCDIEISFIT